MSKGWFEENMENPEFRRAWDKETALENARDRRWRCVGFTMLIVCVCALVALIWKLL